MAGSINVLKFNGKYFALAMILLIVEVFIALFAHDKFIRPYVGDFLVVILLYCFLKAFLDLLVFQVAIFVLLIAYTIEFLQYMHFIKWIGLENSKTGRAVIGTSFEWLDLIAYTLGIILVFILENAFAKDHNKK